MTDSVQHVSSTSPSELGVVPTGCELTRGSPMNSNTSSAKCNVAMLPDQSGQFQIGFVYLLSDCVQTLPVAGTAKLESLLYTGVYSLTFDDYPSSVADPTLSP